MSSSYADLYRGRHDPNSTRFVRWKARIVIPTCQFPQNYPSTTMRTRKSLIALFLVSMLAGIMFATGLGCRSTDSPTSPAQLEQLEQLDDAAYQRFERDVVAHVEVGVGIALDRKLIGDDEMLLIAGLLESLANGRIEPVPGGPISAVLEDAGLTQHEVRAAFLLAEDALAAAGVDWSAELGPRTRQLMLALAEAVVSVRPTEG